METRRTKNARSGDATRKRILDAAAELIYQHGYRATGVSQIIARADVAKATFYAHFQSKEELCLEYLQQYHLMEMDELRAKADEHSDPVERFMSIARASEQAAHQSDFRGCRFLNISAEMPDSAAFAAIAAEHYVSLRELVLELAEGLRRSATGAYSNLDAEQVANDYLLLVGGGMAISKALADPWPAAHIVSGVKRLL